MKEEKVKFGKQEKKIIGILNIPDAKNPPAIIMVHGYGGFAFSERFKFIASEFCKANYAVLRFVFRGYDTVTSDKHKTEFKNLTISGEISDLKEAIDFMHQRDYKKIGLISESLGGAIIILLNDPRIKALALWSANIHIRSIFENLFSKKMIKEVEEKGYSTYTSHTTGGEFLIGRAFWDEVKAIGDIPETKIKAMKCPILIIQGDNDRYFDIEVAKDLYKLANEPKKLSIIKRANHTFTEIKHQKQLIKSILSWFDRWMK